MKILSSAGVQGVGVSLLTVDLRISVSRRAEMVSRRSGRADDSLSKNITVVSSGTNGTLCEDTVTDTVHLLKHSNAATTTQTTH